MAQYTKEYFAQKQREKRARDKIIYTYHLNEKYPGESDKDFRRRFTKRIVIIVDENTQIVMDPFGKVIKTIETETPRLSI